ncbi:MAG: U32 family peptidase [Eubacterium sp.]|nr:U32 family peptidase [Eubacterium sp.]
MSEILAPCGTFDALTAAVNSGADAVYLGGLSFNARQNAANFSDRQLKEAVELCHKNSVKVYVTLNTLVFDRELEELVKTIKAYAEADADGLIIQDLGVAKLAREIVPDMPIHASTQMTVNSSAGARAAKALGFSRVVLGRELSFEQIKEIISNVDIETELFVHGALCVSVSGQCYMSAMLGGRSANRGMCAQPCRLGFSCGNKSEVLSLKDLSLISQLSKLEGAGVTSYKIEGRMKRPEYVAAAVSACRAALDGGIPDTGLLQGVFSRSGFTDGYFCDEFHDMQGIRTKEDVNASAQALSKAKSLYAKPCKRYKCDITADIAENKPVYVTLSVGDISVSDSGAVPQKAVNRETTAEAVCAQLSKLGGTSYYAGDVTASVQPGLSVSASELNELRRSAVSKLTEKILENNSHGYSIRNIQLKKTTYNKPAAPELRCEVYNERQLYDALLVKDFSVIYAPIGLLDENLSDKHMIVVVPPVFLGDCEADVIKRISELKEQGYENMAAHTLSHIQIAKDLGMKAYGTFRLNVTNRYTLQTLKELGVTDAVLSPELTVKAARDLCACSDIKSGIIAYGGLPLMLTRRCPIKDGKPCGAVKRKDCPHCIVDRYSSKMKCLCSDNAVEIINPDVLYLGDKSDDLRGFDFALLRFTDETDIKETVKRFITGETPIGGFTRGLYYKGTIDNKEKI